MASITKFYQRAHKAKNMVLKQYMKEANRLGTIAFFNQIHKSYSMYNTTYLKKNIIKQGSKYEALKILENFLKSQQELIANELTQIKKPNSLEESGLNKLARYKELRENEYKNILSRFSRKLKALGNTRIEKQGKELLHELLGSNLDSFNSTLKLGEALDQTKK
jgi:hypothetical protein